MTVPGALDVTLTVSQINQKIGKVLQAGLPAPVWVVGEIQGYERDAAKASTRRWGQVYFELVEKEKGADSAKASAKAIMWGDAEAQIAERLRRTSEKLDLRDGLQVRFLCAVDFYWPRASLQLKVLDVDPQFTLGDLERARQELLARLKAEGLLDRNRAVALPPIPQCIGLITSDGSAAYYDFIDELKKSRYSFSVCLWDARMQGEETEASVRRGIEALETYPDVAAIVIVRGGGSRSDLIWFDKEKIALAIARCSKPVITGIGHEIDLSVADLVAHAARKTPTAAAQFLVEKLAEFERLLRDVGVRVRDEVLEKLKENRRGLGESVRSWRQSAAILIQGHRARLSDSRSRLLLDARRHVQVGRHELASFGGRLRRGALERLRAERERLKAARKECALKDPRRLLERGYSLVSAGGKLVKSVLDVAPGKALETQLKDGIFSSEVLKILKKGSL